MEKGGIIQRDCCIFWTLMKMLRTSLFMQWRSRGWPKAVFTFCCTSSQRTGRTNGIILEKQQENYLLNSDIYLIMQSNEMVESLKNRNKTQMFYFHPQIGNYLFKLELILFILARNCSSLVHLQIGSPKCNLRIIQLKISNRMPLLLDRKVSFTE